MPAQPRPVLAGCTAVHLPRWCSERQQCLLLRWRLQGQLLAAASAATQRPAAPLFAAELPSRPVAPLQMPPPRLAGRLGGGRAAQWAASEAAADWLHCPWPQPCRVAAGLWKTVQMIGIGELAQAMQSRNYSATPAGNARSTCGICPKCALCSVAASSAWEECIDHSTKETPRSCMRSNTSVTVGSRNKFFAKVLRAAHPAGALASKVADTCQGVPRTDAEALRGTWCWRMRPPPHSGLWQSSPTAS